jgi:hypothetical protein
MPTLKEQLDELTGLKHRLAVWEAVHSMLEEQFTARDGRKTDVKAIRVPNCSIPVVPEETVEDVLQAIGDGPIKDLRAVIDEVEGRQVVVLGEELTS